MLSEPCLLKYISQNNFENLAISTPLGNAETRKSNKSIGAGVTVTAVCAS